MYISLHRVTTGSAEQRVIKVAQKTGEEGVKEEGNFGSERGGEQRRGECFWKHWHTGA